MRTAKAPRGPSAAICLIVKDEVDDIAEWLIHHHLLGFSRLIVYDNESTDGTSQLLAALAKSLPIEHIMWPQPADGSHVQRAAYAHCVAQFRDVYDWIAFVDSDEFLIGPSGETIADLLQRHHGWAGAAGIALQWLIFGSSGLPATHGRLVMEAFTHRAPRDFEINNHVKPIVRPATAIEVINPHFLRLSGEYFNIAGEPVTWESPGIVRHGLARQGDWRLHHYFTRSRAHWQKRMRRGQPDPKRVVRSAAVFDAHDRNDEIDMTAVALVPMIRRRMIDYQVGHLVDQYRAPLADAPARIIGHVDQLNAWRITGWALRDRPSPFPVRFRLTLDGVTFGEVDCERARDDVAISGFNSNKAGFDFAVPLDSMDGQAHVLGFHDAAGGEVMLGSARGQGNSFEIITELPPLICAVDSIGTAGMVRGWATYRGTLKTVRLRAVIDGERIEDFACSLLREDVQKAGYPSADVGFEFRLPRASLDGQTHRLSLWDISWRIPRQVEITREGGVKSDDLEFSQKWTPSFRTHVDGLHNGVIKGWVLRQDDAGRLEGGNDVLVTCNGVHIAQLRADCIRLDVGKAMAADAECGFEFLPPPHFRKPYSQSFHFFVVPFHLELAGSPCTASFLADDRETELIEMSHSVDRIFREVASWRRILRTLMPQRHRTLREYHDWSKSYFAALQTRVEMNRVRRRRHPLVSILCPSFRPRLDHFNAAISSVLAQTYQNWELIIVDDGSESAELSAMIAGFAERDSRIRVITRADNGGISHATNDALAIARGKYVAFFDHDDLLVNVAIEMMVETARSTQAKLLYSDEDKIDDRGLLSEPAFKTDWNYRMLLSVNYICHLLMVDRACLRKVGGLQARYDGAQDHDLLLRLAEHISADDICHVPEILYHWRKSASSTAASTSAKTYAIDAGISAIKAHLDRRGLRAQVRNIHNTTWYSIRWNFRATPKIAIIIPFRDHVETTRRCVDCILANTNYKDYEIILVDNWSVTPEAHDFCAEYKARHATLRVLRVEEEFNYSRLNNIAARASKADYFVLMNNDLFVDNPAWLRTLLNEALADPMVAIVGGKFLYANRTVQHGGVITGFGGVATHAHLGLAEDQPGYGARALFAQELSAVTAACLLVRADAFFRVGALDEQHLKVAFNDVDLCLKMRAAGYKIIWTPDFVAEHHESLSRGSDEERPDKESRFFHEMQTMIERYGEGLRKDPFYSKHFALDGQPFFDLAEPA